MKVNRLLIDRLFINCKLGLRTSDVIESLFCKFKVFVKGFTEIGKLVFQHFWEILLHRILNRHLNRLINKMLIIGLMNPLVNLVCQKGEKFLLKWNKTMVKNTLNTALDLTPQVKPMENGLLTANPRCYHRTSHLCRLQSHHW